MMLNFVYRLQIYWLIWMITITNSGNTVLFKTACNTNTAFVILKTWRVTTFHIVLYTSGQDTM